MSFLSSHRLHWGTHHEHSDDFWIVREKLSHADSEAGSASSSKRKRRGATRTAAKKTARTIDASNLESLGP